MPCGYCDIPGHSIDVCPERLEEYHGLPSDHGDDDDQEIVTDGGSTWANLTGFQRDILETIARLERNNETSYGIAINQRLEVQYGEVNHGRLYPNLDELVELGLLEKSELDKRTNEYALTDDGYGLLIQRVERMAGACEMTTAVADGSGK